MPVPRDAVGGRDEPIGSPVISMGLSSFL